MTKDTMIWQTLSMIVAGMARNKQLPPTLELFEEKVVQDAMSIIDYPKEDIVRVLYTTNTTEFATILAGINT